MADKMSFSYTEPLELLSRKNINWDEKGVNKKEVDKLKRYIKVKLRREFESTCYFCREEVSEANSNYDIEHILPKAQEEYINFTFNPKNLALSCERCNRLKGKSDVLLKSELKPNYIFLYDEYPFTSEKFKIIHPYLDNYYEHIELEGIFYLVKNNSDKGANTIKYYHLARLSLAESKIKIFEKIKNPLIRDILMNKTITDKITIDSLLGNSLSNNKTNGTNSYGITILIDNYLNPFDKSETTQNRIGKLKQINDENYKNFIEFRRLINAMNKKFGNWYDNPNWYINNKYINEFKRNSCFNNVIDKEYVIKNIITVLNALKGLYGTTKLREQLEGIKISDIHDLVSTFSGYFNHQAYNNNSQLELITPLRYALYCSDAYNSTDISNDISEKLAIDTKIVKGLNKIFKGKRKEKLSK